MGKRCIRGRGRLALLLTAAAAVTSILTLTAAAGTIGTAAGFEDDDGNLAVNSTFDWNGFAPLSWTGSAPYQSASTTVSGWAFTGLTDAQKTSTDTGYAGGTKQDADCPAVIGTSSPNKDDLKRVYVAHKQVNGHIYLELAWVRIPQNTTSPSAHVAFEFNQGTTACGAGSDGLVKRQAGDMLIVYDFEGGSTDTPTITIRRWIASGTCDVSNDPAPCWGVAQNLTAAGIAEARVNTSTVGTVQDALAPSPPETLGLNEFGEAGIDLTAAGIFTSQVCTSFGQVEGVSRSSGNSGTAQMEDLVGPGHIRISNCGTLIVKKITDPSPDPTNTSFAFSETGPNTSLAFGLHNGESNTNTQAFTGTYSVAETVPANWQLTSASCDNGSGTLSASTLGGISVGTDETVTCTFYDKLLLGAIKISKTSSKGTALGGAQFSITGPGGYSNTVTTDAAHGSACVDHLPFGTYSVQETAAPPGYAIDDQAAHDVVVNASSSCGDGSEATYSASDTPLTDLSVLVQAEAPGATQSSISCVDGDGNPIASAPLNDPAQASALGLKPGTYTCTVVIDP